MTKFRLILFTAILVTITHVSCDEITSFERDNPFDLDGTQSIFSIPKIDMHYEWQKFTPAINVYLSGQSSGNFNVYPIQVRVFNEKKSLISSNSATISHGTLLVPKITLSLNEIIRVPSQITAQLSFQLTTDSSITLEKHLHIDAPFFNQVGSSISSCFSTSYDDKYALRVNINNWEFNDLRSFPIRAKLNLDFPQLVIESQISFDPFRQNQFIFDVPTLNPGTSFSYEIYLDTTIYTNKIILSSGSESIEVKPLLSFKPVYNNEFLGYLFNNEGMSTQLDQWYAVISSEPQERFGPTTNISGTHINYYRAKGGNINFEKIDRVAFGDGDLYEGCLESVRLMQIEMTNSALLGISYHKFKIDNNGVESDYSDTIRLRVQELENGGYRVQAVVLHNQ